MGLEPQDLRKIVELRKIYNSGTSAAILGDCVFYFDKYQLFEIAQGECIREFKHKKAELSDFARVLGFDRVETLDIYGNPTIKVDLQEEIPDKLKARYDWIIDAGTMFCCFDISGVWRNILQMLKGRGFIFHLSSLAGYLGRSYYSFSPRLFLDFYNANGFEILEMGVRLKTGKSLFARGLNKIFKACGLKTQGYLEWREINTGDCFLSKATLRSIEFCNSYKMNEPAILPNNSLIMCLAKRSECKEFIKAIPSYYKNKGVI